MRRTNSQNSVEVGTSQPSESMLLSVIIPTFRRKERLRGLLRAIVKQVVDATYEVIVIDDGGGGLDSLVKEFEGLLPLRFLAQANSGPAQARNNGARVARGQRLVFIDDDCVPEPDWLQQIALAHAEIPDAAIGGTTVNLLSENSFSAASQLLIDFLYLYFQLEEGRKDAFLTTNNASVPRERFWEIGGFDVGFERAAGEDREFFDRWRFLGDRIVFRPQIVVGHTHWLDFKGFVLQHFCYGQAARRFWLLKWAREGKRKRVRTGFFQDLLLYPLQRHGLSVKAVTQTFLFVLCQVVNAAGYLWAWCHERKASSLVEYQ